MVWDKSHRAFYPTFEFQYSQRRPEGRWHGQWNQELGSDEYKAALHRVRQAEPVDAHGPAGTGERDRLLARLSDQAVFLTPLRVAVVFWHGRVGHDAGPNYGTKIRQAILYDFSRADMTEQDSNPPSQSMWRDWSSQVQAIAAANGHADVTRLLVARGATLPPSPALHGGTLPALAAYLRGARHWTQLHLSLIHISEPTRPY